MGNREGGCRAEFASIVCNIITRVGRINDHEIEIDCTSVLVSVAGAAGGIVTC